MRVLVFTADEPLYLPLYLEPILSAHGACIERVVLANPRSSPLTQARRQYGMYGPRAGARMAARYVRSRVLARLPPSAQRRLTGRYHDVRSAAREHGVPVETVPDVRAAPFVERVRESDPDVVLSVVCGQRLPAAVLGVPDHAVNVHGSLLPKYRGRATAFWPLYHGEDRTGVTAHLMTEELDAGPIVQRRAFPIDADDTVHDVMSGIVEEGAELAVDVLDRLRAGESLVTEPNPTTEDDYYSLPVPAERRAFLRDGGRFG